MAMHAPFILEKGARTLDIVAICVSERVSFAEKYAGATRISRRVGEREGKSLFAWNCSRPDWEPTALLHSLQPRRGATRMSLNELSSCLPATPIFSYRVTATLSIRSDACIETRKRPWHWMTSKPVFLKSAIGVLHWGNISAKKKTNEGASRINTRKAKKKYVGNTFRGGYVLYQLRVFHKVFQISC